MGKSKSVKNLFLGILGTCIAIYILFPFYLVVMNSFKR